MSYQYEVLDERCIRLMVLKAGSKQDGLAIELETVRLGLSRPFEAISYVWGYAPRTIEIGSPHGSFTATENLGEALRAFRYQDQDRTLWADAICINQGDPGERAQQVKLMAQIFGYARQVLVWLGPFDLAQQAFEAASNLACDQKYEMILVDHLQHGRPSAAISFLRQLAQRPWFQRTWTMQEIGEAREATVYCGDFSIPWNHLSQAYYILYNHVCTESPGFIRLSVTQLRDIMALRTWKHDANASFLDLLALASRRQAADARDKVFALLSHLTALVDKLNRPGELLIEPDYSKGIAEVYTDTAKALIRRDRNLDVMSYVEGPLHLRPDNLASWVPDWSHAAGPRNLFCIMRHFAAAAGFPDQEQELHTEAQDGYVSDDEIPHREPHQNGTPQFRLSYCVWELHVRGIPLGTVEWHRSLALWDSWPAMPTTAALYRELSSAWRGMFQDQVHTSPEAELLSTFARCLSGGMLHPTYNVPNGAQKHDQDFQSFWQDIQACQGQASDNAIRKAFLDSILHACQGRALFCTENGLFGLGPVSLRHGDDIFVLQSGRVPLALRRCQNSCSMYTVVGECYVDGMMYGEAARLRNLVQNIILL